MARVYSLGVVDFTRFRGQFRRGKGEQIVLSGNFAGNPSIFHLTGGYWVQESKAMIVSVIFGAVVLLKQQPPALPVSAAEAIARLKAGNKRYVSSMAEHKNQDAATRTALARDQKPFAIVLSCADSRVPPEIVYDQGLGDLFVIRVAGNVPDTEIMASIEYAVEKLGTKLLVVLGHERCGAVKAALDSFYSKGKSGAHDGPSFIPTLIDEIMPAVRATKDKEGIHLDNAIAQNVINTVNEVAKTSPFKKFIEDGDLTILGSVYDLDSGEIKNIYLKQSAKAGIGAKKLDPPVK
ncbi:MAG: carbonic anhydrase [Armatimonadetes bacterium]|nr:carbonic anhydrase [Armatimonadota bacterium]